MQKNTKTRPFLKWAGNKFSLLDLITARLPTARRLIEPFAGSGALFLNSNFSKYCLADINEDLITIYRLLQTDPEAIIQAAKRLFVDKNNTRERYYLLRDRFNTCKDQLQRAALFLFLNRHGYNGLCRYNSKGQYNVPFGRYRKPYLPEEDLLYCAHKLQHATLCHADFQTVMRKAKLGDVIYCDPPYIPLTKTANFTTYSQGNFDLAEQEALAELAKASAKRGIPVLISNHDTPLTRKLYRGAKIHSFDVPRYISCKIDERRPVKEVLALFS